MAENVINAGNIVIPPRGFEEIQAWVAEHAQIRAMHEIGIEDYIAARASILHLGLFTVGFALAAQSIEKLLKCYLMLGGAQLDEMKKHLHNLDRLLTAATAVSPPLDARRAEFSGLCVRLQAWYQSRYPSAPNSATEWMRNDLAPIDAMVVYLEENMPLPEVAKPLIYSGGEMGTQWSSIFVRLFSVQTGQHRHALVDENAALAGRERELEGKFNAARSNCMLKAKTEQEFTEHRRMMDEQMTNMLAAFTVNVRPSNEQ